MPLFCNDTAAQKPNPPSEIFRIIPPLPGSRLIYVRFSTILRCVWRRSSASLSRSMTCLQRLSVGPVGCSIAGRISFLTETRSSLVPERLEVVNEPVPTALSGKENAGLVVLVVQVRGCPRAVQARVIDLRP